MEKKDKIYFGLVIICIFLVALFVYFLRTETSQCLRNPYVYGAKEMGNVYCSCQQDQGRTFPAYFYFNDTSFNADPKGEELYTPINYGNLTIIP